MIKEEPIQRMERFGTRPKKKTTETVHADFAMLQTGHRRTIVPH